MKNVTPITLLPPGDTATALAVDVGGRNVFVVLALPSEAYEIWRYPLP
jgi:hypothetical protein